MIKIELFLLCTFCILFLSHGTDKLHPFLYLTSALVNFQCHSTVLFVSKSNVFKLTRFWYNMASIVRYLYVLQPRLYNKERSCTLHTYLSKTIYIRHKGPARAQQFHSRQWVTRLCISILMYYITRTTQELCDLRPGEGAGGGGGLTRKTSVFSFR